MKEAIFQMMHYFADDSFFLKIWAVHLKDALRTVEFHCNCNAMAGEWNLSSIVKSESNLNY